MAELNGVFQHYLGRIEHLLQRIPDDCLDASLAPDMLNLAEHLRTAIQFSLRILCPLMHRELPDFEARQLSRASLQHQLEQTRQYISALPIWSEADSQQRIRERAGFADLEFSAADFVDLYGLPNFYFHLSMVYAIARAQGVPLSKGDFDGWHRYPQGFSFVGSAN